MVPFINGLFGAQYPQDSTVTYPNTETVNENLKKLLSDTIIVINGTDVFHIEAQIRGDANMALRIFRYGFEEGLKTKKARNGLITVKFPQARVIYWEGAPKTPDTLRLNFEFPDGKIHSYRVESFKFLEHSIEDLERRNMGILLPFYVLKYRKQAQRAKTTAERQSIAEAMKKLLEELIAAEDRCLQSGLLDRTDYLTVIDHLERLYIELYQEYNEFKEADIMLQEKLEPRWKEIERHTREETWKEAQEKFELGRKEIERRTREETWKEAQEQTWKEAQENFELGRKEIERRTREQVWEQAEKEFRLKQEGLAGKLKAMGLSREQIAAVTELSLEEIEKL